MIGPCERFEELWLDYLYGLCDAEECRELEAHLPLCPTCQSALAEAKACQARLAVAARAVEIVPEFKQPQDEPAPLSLATQVFPADVSKPRDERSESRGSSPAPTPAPVLPLRPRRPLVRRLWPVWAAAAAVLVAVVGGSAWHRQGLGEHDRAVARAKREVLAVEARLDQLQKDADAERQALEAEREVEPVRVEVIGPAVTQPGAPFTANVATRGLDGRPQAAELEVNVLREGGAVVHREKLASRGTAQVTVPGGWKAGNLVFEVLAKRPDDANEAVAVRENVQVQPVSHALHVALNKAVFQPGEVIFMRALALERFSLRPAQKPLPLRFALLDGQGRETIQTTAATGAGGIASAGLAVVPALPPGQYTVQVTGPDLATQRRALEIVPRLGNVEVFADRDAYRGGEQMKLTVDVRAADGKPVPNQALEVRSSVAGSRAATLPPVTATTNAEGRAKVDVPLPSTLEGAQVDVEVQARGFMGGFGGGFMGGFGGGLGAQGGFNTPAPGSPLPGAPAPAPGGGVGKIGKKTGAPGRFEAFNALNGLPGGTSIRRSFPVMPTRLEIDFYPEGGNLVAGVPQRVYYRVRSPLGEPVRPDGRVVVLAGNKVIHASAPGQGIGVFRLTPDPRQRYAARIAGPTSVSEIRDPFRGLAIQTDGIGLAADSVVAAGAPLALEVHNRGAARAIALVVQCRGQVVTQKIIEAAASPGKIALDLPAEVAGVLRVTAYELRDGRLEPRCERLVYRAPARKLDLKVALETHKNGKADAQNAKTGAAPGDMTAKAAGRATLAIEARTESGQPAPAWAVAVVTDDRHRAEASELSLAQHFLIAEELGPDADVYLLAGLADDSPDARTTLDLLLGVHGWRRFVPRQSEPAHLAREDFARDADADRADADRVHEARSAESTAVALFHRESGDATVEARTRINAKQRAAAVLAVHKERTEQAAVELEEERRSAAAALGAAVEARDAYARLPGEYYRLGLGVLAAAAFLAACLLIVWGLVRAARRRGHAAPPFAGAIAAFALCLMLYIGLSPGVHIEEQTPRGGDDPAVAMAKKKDASETAPRPASPPSKRSVKENEQAGDTRQPVERGAGGPAPDALPKSPSPSVTGKFQAPKSDAAKSDANALPSKSAPSKSIVPKSEGADPTASSRVPAPAQPLAPPPPSANIAPNPQALVGKKDMKTDGDKAAASGGVADKSAPRKQAVAQKQAVQRTMTERAAEPAQQSFRRDQARGMPLSHLEELDRARGAKASRDGPTSAAGYADYPALTGRYAKALDQQKANLDALRMIPMNAAQSKKAAPPGPTATPSTPGDVASPPTTVVPGLPTILMESAEVAREFAYRRLPGAQAPPTLLWHPTLRLPSGRADVHFDLPAAPSTYRVLIYGHTDDGRLGFFEERLNLPR